MGVPITLLLRRRCRYVVSMTVHEGASGRCEEDAGENNSSGCDKFIFGGWVQEAVMWRCQRH